MRAIDLRNVPAEIVRAVDQDARKRGVSANVLVTEILCKRYLFPYEITLNKRNKYTGVTSDHWLLRVPDGLRQTLVEAASWGDKTVTGLVLVALADHYGIQGVNGKIRAIPVLTPEQAAEAKVRYEAGESLRALSAEYGITRPALTRAIKAL